MQKNIQAAYFAFILHPLTPPHAPSTKTLRFFGKIFPKTNVHHVIMYIFVFQF